MKKADTLQIPPITLEDAKGVHILMTSNAQNFIKYFPKTLQQNLSLSDSEVFCEKKALEFNQKIEFLFTLKMEKTVIGLVYIKELDWIKKEGEFAYCIDHAFSGKGWMSQAITCLSEKAFNELHLEVLNIIAHKSNIASVRVAEKCGFIWKKTLKNEYTPVDGHPMDMELYQLKNNR